MLASRLVHGFPSPAEAWRVYRLTDGRGLPHPVLDELFESLDAAHEAALNWIEQQSLLAADAAEGQALVHSLLVTVTQFFRNPDAFVALAKPLQPLVAARPAGERLRVWVPGCATGEEVYSIAMTVSEAMGHPARSEEHTSEL